MSLKNLFLVIPLLVLFSACKSSEHPFTKKDIRHAQKLYGLSFEKEGIDTMYNYLGRNLNAYDSIREHPIENNVFPALLFNPLPNNFQFPESEENPSWEPKETKLPENIEELAFYSIRELAFLLKNQMITSEALTQMYLNRIEKYDPQLEAVITVTKELALQQAKKADQEIQNGNYKGLLHGIPYGVKDLMAVKDYKTTWGAASYKDQVFDYTATVVEQLESAGAVLIAKLVSGTLARGDVWYGGKTKNPWDITQGATGSSAGSGSATAAGLVAFSLGTETLGSIVSPSNRCGLSGLRPTYGRVSRNGIMSLSWSMDKVGPICRSAEDCAIVFSYILGKSDTDQSIIEAPFNFNINTDISQLKVAYVAQEMNKDTTGIGQNNLNALAQLKLMGIQMDSISLPNSLPNNMFDIILRAESGAFFDELIRSGAVDELVEQHQGSRANSLRQSRFIPAVEYLQANRERKILIEEMHQLMKNYDVLIAPTLGSKQLYITNLTGHPALTVPTGLDEKGHPTSITLIGNLFEEGKLLQLARAYQIETDFDEKHPPLFMIK